MLHHAFYCGKYAASLIKEYECAEVLGIYSAGTYLLFGGELVLIYDSTKNSVPFGIGIENYPAFRDRISADDKVTVEDGKLFIGNECILPTETDVRSCSLPRFPEKDVAERAAKLLREKKQTGFACLTGGETTDPYAKRAKACADGLFCALKDGSTAELEDCTARLVGLGGGLTPSGDDLLCGILYALYYCEGTRSKAAELAAAVEKAKKNTNIISRRYLESAARGEYFGLVAEFATALLSGDTEPALDALLTVGSSSGGDIAAGMLLAYNLVK
ncbi:MAG: DUF2877 domain-containing protein [Clostridia bacterium]|nr:DUF2877 domain-containing protein [Clostridia bacterium]